MSAAPETLTLTSDLNELSRLMARVDAFCAELGAGEADVSALHLALEEIVTNVIVHGYAGGVHHSFTVTLEEAAPGRIRAVVSDDAPAFNPLSRAEVDISAPLETRAVGGLGVHLVRKLMDVCAYERRDGRNVFSIERKLNRAPGAAGTVSIAASRLEATAVLALAGRLDGLSSPEVEAQATALTQTGIRTLIFDLSALDYVGSAGLRIFLVAAKMLKAEGGRARFHSLTPTVRQVFEISGLLGTLEVE